MSKFEIYLFIANISLVLYGSVAQSKDNTRYVCLLDDPSDHGGQFCPTAMNPVLNHEIQSRLNTLEGQLTSVTKTLSGLEMLLHSEDAPWKKDFESMLGRLESVLTKMENQPVSPSIPKMKSPKFQQIGSNFYYIENNFQLNWISADKTCQIMGGQLAIIRNHAELVAIFGNLDFKRNYYIKIYQPILDSNGGHIDDCLTILNSLIHISPCGNEHYFVCQAVLE